MPRCCLTGRVAVVRHWLCCVRCGCRGERRLFLYELEFLTQYGVRPGTVVVYAGCAPATRLTFLAELFPHIHFVLVDPVPLDVDESATTNVRVRQEPFTDAIARELRAAATAEEKTLLFIANATADTQLGGQTDDRKSERERMQR